MGSEFDAEKESAKSRFQDVVVAGQPNRLSKIHELERAPSEVGSVVSIAALENDVKYLQRSLLLKDEQIEILKREKDLLSKRYIKETESMHIEMEDLRVRLSQYEEISGRPPTLNAQIERITRQLQESKMAKRSSLEKFNESLSRKKSYGSEAHKSESKIDSGQKIKLELDSKMS